MMVIRLLFLVVGIFGWAWSAENLRSVPQAEREVKSQQEAASSYSDGYIRTLYVDSSDNSEVQVVSYSIGTCFQSKLDPTPFRWSKLRKVIVDKTNNLIIFKLVEFRNQNCQGKYENPSEQRFPRKHHITTQQGVTLEITSSHVESLSDAIQFDHGDGRQYVIADYLASPTCEGLAYKFTSGSGRCASYPKFYGKVSCRADDNKLQFKEYPFSNDHTCVSGEGSVLKKQPFACSNQGSASHPAYQKIWTADCA